MDKNSLIKDLDLTLQKYEEIAGKNLRLLEYLSSIIVKNRLKISDKLKPDTLLVSGKSGTGKTFLLQNFLSDLDIPHKIIDSKSFSEVGYQGNSLSELFDSFSNEELKKIENGYVIIFDEFDKLQEKQSFQKDISGRSVQEGFLKMLDGIEITVKGQSRFPIKIHTKDLFFIFVGSFQSIGEEYDNLKKKMKSNGFSAELVNRITNVVTLEPYSMDDFIKFLTKSDNSVLKNNVRILNELGYKVSFVNYEDTVKKIVQEGLAEDWSFRGIENSVNNMFNKNLMKILRDNTSSRQIFIDGLTITCNKVE